ncbi:TonB-dependent receptor plug domain-containing protein [Paracoccus tegillarcae]|nr:TonB-dependent receptor [Paracoccus tegillarcae]
MTRPLHLLIATTALGSAVLPAAAQEASTPYMLPEITILAAGETTDLDRSGSSVSVVEGYALQTPARPVSAVLQDMPGVTVRRSGPLGTTASVSVRGAPGQYVPVLIDGIDVSDPAAGQPSFDFGGLTGTGIGRIELLRGAQSALYGSRAVSGIVDIRSLRPTEDGFHHSFGIEAGSYDTLAASYGLTYRDAATELAFSASRIKTDGFSARDENDGNFETDGYDATRLSFYAARHIDDQTTIGLNGFSTDSTGNFDEFGGDTFGTPGDEFNTLKAYGLRAFAEFTTGSVEHDLSLTRYRSDRISSSNGVADAFDGTRTKLSWQGATDIGAAGGRLIFGADREKEKAEGNGEATLTGAFAEIAMPFGPDVDVNLSVRRDDHSRFGGFTSARMSGVWRARPDLLVRASVGNGFRAPSLYELFGPFGDASLEREDSLSAELGVEKRWGDDAHLRATAFLLNADNMIGWDDRGTDDWSDDGYNQVEGKSRRRGVEIDGRYALAERFSLTGAYTYTDNVDSTGWADVAEHVLTLGAETTFATGTVAGLSLHHEADRALDLPSFATVDLSLSHPLTDQATGYIRVENLLDREYQLNDGYGTSDRAFYVGLRAGF